MRIGNVAELNFYLKLPTLQRIANELEDGALDIVQRHHMNAHNAIADVVPSMVAKQICAHAIAVIRLAVVSGIKGDAFNLKADTLVMAFLCHGEYGAIAGFYAIICPTAVEGSGETVQSVLIDECIILWKILLTSVCSALIVIIRLHRAGDSLCTHLT